VHLYTDTRCLEHRVPNGHPERPERLAAVLNHLKACGFIDDHPMLAPEQAKDVDIQRAHSLAHVKDITTFATKDNLEADKTSMVPVDPDTWMSQHSLTAARLAAGAVCNGIDDLISGRTQRVFCAVRPPGHHAERDAAMGFCLFNSIAIGALKALASPTIERVAILDFDVHHGNGTVDIFTDNPAVMVCSSFQHPHYPNRKFDVRRDHLIHTPLAAGTAGTEFRRQIEADWLPALERHAPELILVSAGFDAHQRDPLAQLNLVEDDYAWITDLIVSTANQYSEGRVISTLEGGYDLQALTQSVETHLAHLAPAVSR